MTAQIVWITIAAAMIQLGSTILFPASSAFILRTLKGPSKDWVRLPHKFVDTLGGNYAH